VTDYLPPGSLFESAYFVDHILNNFQALPAVLLAKRNKKAFVIHMDNTPIHKSKVSNKNLEYANPSHIASTKLTGSDTLGLFLTRSSEILDDRTRIQLTTGLNPLDQADF
jgi:hypothetical protein